MNAFHRMCLVHFPNRFNGAPQIVKLPLGQGRSLFKNQKAGQTPGPRFPTFGKNIRKDIYQIYLARTRNIRIVRTSTINHIDVNIKNHHIWRPAFSPSTLQKSTESCRLPVASQSGKTPYGTCLYFMALAHGSQVYPSQEKYAEKSEKFHCAPEWWSNLNWLGIINLITIISFYPNYRFIINIYKPQLIGDSLLHHPCVITLFHHSSCSVLAVSPSAEAKHHHKANVWSPSLDGW